MNTVAGAAPDAATIARTGVRGPKVLVADDSAIVRKMVSTRLTADGYDVLEAVDGEQAVDLACSENPSAVVLDNFMPKLDGFGVVRALRANEETQTVPIVMLTEESFGEDQLAGIDVGIEDYVPKPFSPSDLSSLLQRILSR